MTTTGMGAWIYRLEELTKDHNDLVGKKCANLGEMTRAGFRVPRGFALGLAAYKMFMEQSGASAEIKRYLRTFKADPHDPAHLKRWAEASTAIRGIMEIRTMPRGMEQAIGTYYEELCRTTGVPNCAVAVRSAGPASHPGQYETFLHVKGTPDVVRHIVKVWASTFNQQSLVMRARGNYPLDYDPIGVAVLQMVSAKAAGVMFTLNPANGDRAKIMIEGNWGLGESVVSGSVTPDEWVVDKVVLEITSRTISPKELEYTIDAAGNVVAVGIPTERRAAPCLTNEEVIELARVGKQIEQHYGSPQDIEWVIDVHLPFPQNVYIVQTRPETVWSKKEAESKLQTSGSVTVDIVNFWRNVKA